MKKYTAIMKKKLGGKTCPHPAISTGPNFRYPKNYLVNSFTATGLYRMQSLGALLRGAAEVMYLY
jgi:hypothetical protein